MWRWDILILVCLVYTVNCTPYTCAFLEVEWWDAWFVVDRMTDIVFFAEV